MITTGGNGDWSTIASLLQDIEIPRVLRVRQKFVHPAPVDVAEEIRAQFAARNILSRVRPGETVAITVGSRGIVNQAAAVRALALHDDLKLVLRVLLVPMLRVCYLLNLGLAAVRPSVPPYVQPLVEQHDLVDVPEGQTSLRIRAELAGDHERRGHAVVEAHARRERHVAAKPVRQHERREHVDLVVLEQLLVGPAGIVGVHDAVRLLDDRGAAVPVVVADLEELAAIPLPVREVNGSGLRGQAGQRSCGHGNGCSDSSISFHVPYYTKNRMVRRSARHD